MCTRGDIQGIFLEIETRNWLGTIALNHVIQTTQGLPISVIDQQMNMEQQKYRKSFPPEKKSGFSMSMLVDLGAVQGIYMGFSTFGPVMIYGGFSHILGETLTLFSLIQWIITIPM